MRETKHWWHSCHSWLKILTAFEKMKTEILYGTHPVIEALKADRRTVLEIYIIAGNRMSKNAVAAVKLAEKKNIPVKKVSPEKLETVSGTSENQGVGAKVSPYPIVAVQDILKEGASNGSKNFLLLVDSLEDPHNLGALIRTGLCAGIDGVIIPKNRSVQPIPSVSKASAGALEHVLLARVTNMVDTIKLFKEKGIWIAGTDSGGDQTIYTADLACNLAIVIGGEGKGIRPLVKKNCDYLLSIPRSGPVDSLNASVAGAVVLYEAYRQRQEQEKNDY